MRGVRLEHGAALRVPKASDEASWSVLLAWVGPSGHRLDAETLSVEVAGREVLARSGDWIVLAADGGYHVGRCGGVVIPLQPTSRPNAPLN
ncbi:MAG TPA: hypothetical protein VFN88_10620 [Caulobacteraceae bacterium]|nr:hypothetical protein [Caulobacteraceae bacterium]